MLVRELETVAGGINVEVSILEDINTKFFQVVEDMDNNDEPENLRIRFEEWRREMWILSRLMYHSMESLKNDRKNVKYLSEGFFEEVIRNS